MSFDTVGRKFVCSNSRHIMSFMYDEKYAARNPFYAMPGAVVDIPVDGPAAEVYRISPEEPWRVIRTKWRVSGVAPGMIEGGGRSAGYFTGATGTTIYRGNAFPPEFLNNSFTGDAGGNLVHRKLIVPDGVGVKAMRPADEEKIEFFTSKDTWFRPVQFANAPDGTLYVIDMYREVIEHPWSLPEQIKKHLDLNSGNDRGRIYRITPDGFKQPKPPRMGKFTTAQLIATLENPNGWQRDTAARLIYERQDKTSANVVAKLAETSPSSSGRLSALHVLDGLKALNENHIIKALGDRDANVREHAVRLAEKFLPNGIPSAPLWAKLTQLTNEVSTNVLYQFTFTLGEIKNPERISILAQVFYRNFENSWMQAAALSSLPEGAPEMFNLLTTRFPIAQSKSGQEFLAKLAALIGAQNQPNAVNQVLGFLSQVNDPALSFALVRALGDGLQRAKTSLAAVARNGSLTPIFTRANETAANDQSPVPERMEAIQLLGLNRYADVEPILLPLLNPNQPPEIQLAAIKTLARFNEAPIANELTKRWTNFTDQARSEALTVLLARPERASVLLNAIQAKTISPADLTTAQIRFLRGHSNTTVRTKALGVLGAATISKRQNIVNTFLPALKLKGDAAHGKQIYEERCLSCHRLGGEGYVLGPD
ncbi:MAG: PVC-type heme-binding CxxCH protein, partial [Limisphaerales bacterium]